MANENTTGEETEYEYEEVAEGEEAIAYEYAEAPAAEDGVEYEYVEVPAAEAETPAAEEGVEYEYVEVPAAEAEAPAAEEGVEYEYVEAPAAEEGVEYEYVEAPAAEAEAPAAEEGVEYEYVEAPAAEAETPAAEAEAPAAEEGVEYEYVEAPAAEAEAPAAEESVEPPLPPEPETPVQQDDDFLSADALESLPETAGDEPPLPPEDDAFGLSVSDLETVSDEPAAPTEAALTEEVSAPVEEPVAVEETEEAAAPAEEAPVAESVPDETPVAAAAVAVAAVAAIDASDAKEEPATPDVSASDEPFVYEGRSGTLSFNGSAITLSNATGIFNHLENWHLQITEMSVSQLEGQAGQTVALTEGLYNQGLLITGDGEQYPFANVSELTVPAADPDQCMLLMSGTTVLSLAGHAGETIELENASGMLIGPNDSLLHFSGLTKLVVPEAVQTAEPAEAPQSAPAAETVVRIFADSDADGKAFVFTAEDGEKSTDAAVVLIKTGYRPYGWNVAFDDGTTMSLADVRIYQSKHGDLPAANGTITYKDAKLSFTGAKRIRIVEKPAYCGYGVAPEA